MCIAILKPHGTRKITKAEFDECWRINKDGFGMMYQIKKGKKMEVKIYKTMDKDEAFKAFTESQENENIRDIGFHFRIGTHGTLGIHNCHPFYAGNGMYMLHNGMLPLRDPFGVKSDTNLLADMLIEQKFGWWENKAVVERLEMFASGSKLVFMSPENSFILNSKLGHEKDGIWFSNHSYVVYEPYKYKGPSNGGGYLSHATQKQLPATTEYANDAGLSKKQRKKLEKLRLQTGGFAQKRIDAQREKTKLGIQNMGLEYMWKKFKSDVQGKMDKWMREEINGMTFAEHVKYWTDFLGHSPTDSKEMCNRITPFYRFLIGDPDYVNEKDSDSLQGKKDWRTELERDMEEVDNYYEKTEIVGKAVEVLLDE